MKRYLSYLVERGFDLANLKVFACQKGFRYGNSQTEGAKMCVLLPVNSWWEEAAGDDLRHRGHGSHPLWAPAVGEAWRHSGLPVPEQAHAMAWV